METAPRAAIRRPELVTDHDASPATEPARELTVTAVYELSETGRKASLLSGGDGHALQQLQVQVPASRLHLVTVDPEGTARLKLRPRFELDAEHRVVRSDSVPTYDAPPSLEDLFREAARNHELERVYQAERNAARAKRREAERAPRDEVARAFLADKSQRALVHPAPSPKRCTLSTGQGRMYFDIATDEGLARDVPAEAHRRFRADLAAKKEKNLRERAAQLALHEEKKRFIAEWIEKHGTPDQRERQAAGMLPMEEAIEAISEKAFAALAHLKVYARDGRQQLGMHLQRMLAVRDVRVFEDELIVKTSVVRTATASQWAALQEVQRCLPGAKVALREHRISSTKHTMLPPLALHSIVVTARCGPLTVRREYSQPNGDR